MIFCHTTMITQRFCDDAKFNRLSTYKYTCSHNSSIQSIRQCDQELKDALGILQIVRSRNLSWFGHVHVCQRTNRYTGERYPAGKFGRVKEMKQTQEEKLA